MSAPLPGRVPKRSILGRRRSREGARDGDCDRSDPEGRRQGYAPDEARGGGGASVGGRTRRARQGGATRRCPRDAHAVFEPPSTRPDPVDVLERQAKTRVPELVPIRYGRMLVSPFTFYRGAAAIMAQDLARDAAVGADGAVLRGCAPVELRRVRVAGATAGVRRQRLRRDAPGSVGVGRQAAGGEHADRGARQRLPRQGAGADRARHGRPVPHGDGRVRRDEATSTCGTRTWTSRACSRTTARSSSRSAVKRTEKELAKARTKDSMTAFSKLTHVVDGQPRIIDQSPLIVPIEQLAARTAGAMSCSTSCAG